MRLLVFSETIVISQLRLLYLAQWYYTKPHRHKECPWADTTFGAAFESQCCFKTCGKLFSKAKEKGQCPCKTYPKDFVDYYVKRILQEASEIENGKEYTCQLGSERAKRIG